ncbi:MAG: CRISPR-associated helicase Cas3' [Methanothermobacter sp.]|nr:CRISPR-associated helicase Cas3' [Methanothermobacter sp.]
MSFSFELRSHPEKKLIDHLRNVAKLSEKIVNSKSIKNKNIFSEVAYLIGISHDFGKSTSAFQRYILNSEKSKYAHHGFISSLFGYYLVEEYLEKKDILDEFWYIPPIAWIVINKHHGNIRNIRDEEIVKLKDQNKIETVEKQIEDIKYNHLDEVNSIYKELLGEDFDTQAFLNKFDDTNVFTERIYRAVKKICKKKKMKYYFYVLFFYSILLDADKLDASGYGRIPERIEILEKDIVDQYKENKFGKENAKGINRLREMAYQEVNSQIKNLSLEDDRILSINLPTGLGKTLTGFSFALGLQEKIQKKKGFRPKIIYSLPFLSIIDQNSAILAEILAGRNMSWDELSKMEKEDNVEEKIPSNLFLKHHHLADIKYKEERDSELNIIEDVNKSLLLTESWHSEIVITTFFQFFHSLVTNRNRAARKFHNIINSIIILDEIQSIPHKYWLLINKILKYLTSEFNCWIILMTATKPLIFSKEDIKELVKNRNMYFEYFDRVNFNFDLSEKDLESFKEQIFEKIVNEKNKDIMVVLNTINSSKDVYNYLKESLSKKYGEEVVDENGICKFPDLELINMSTHVLPSFRLSRIDHIKKDKKRKVIITTQLIEAGVDISVDIIYRDLAPLDSIIQTAGRCNRNNEKKKGTVNIILLKDKNNRKFYKYIYDSTLIDITKGVIDKIGTSVSEKDFTMRAANEYYHLVKERGSQQESREVIEHLTKLEFSDTSKFQLIEKDVPTISIFVEINEEAKKIRKNMEKILELKGFEKKKRLIELKKHINSFTLSINYNKRLKGKIDELNQIDKIEDFKYIPKEKLDKWYRLDVGFWPSESD